MNGEFPSNNPRTELEARLTAFILGELPAHEAAALRQAMEEDTQLAALYERLKAAIKLVREAAASPAEQTKDAPAPLRLSEERRQKLLAAFKTVAPKEFVRPKPVITGRRLLEIAAILVILGAIAAMLTSESAHEGDVLPSGKTQKVLEDLSQQNASSKPGTSSFSSSQSIPVILGNTPTNLPEPVVRLAQQNIVLPSVDNFVDASQSGGGGNAGIPMNYAEASDISVALPLLGAKSESQSGPADGHVGQFTVNGSRTARLLQDGSLDTNFDPGPGLGLPPQVEIKAKFVDITQNVQAENFTNAGSLSIATGGTLPSINGAAGTDYASNSSGAFPGPALSGATVTNQATFSSSAFVAGEAGKPGVIAAPASGDIPALGHLFGAASDARKQKDYRKAGEDYDRILAADPGNQAALAAQRENRKLRDMQAGTIPSQELIDRIRVPSANEIQTATMVQDGKLLFEVGKQDEAEAKLKQALREDPGNAAASQYQKLIDEKKKADATRGEPNSPEALVQLEKTWDVEKREGKLEPHPAAIGGIDNSWQGGVTLGPGAGFELSNKTPANSGADTSAWSLSGAEKPFYADNYDVSDGIKKDASQHADVNLTLTTTPAPTARPSEPIIHAYDGHVEQASLNQPQRPPVAPNNVTNSFAFDDSKLAGLEAKDSSDVYSLSVVGYVNVPLTNGITVFANPLDFNGPGSTNTALAYDEKANAISSATDEAVRRQSDFDGTFGRIASSSNNYVVTNGVYPAAAEMGNVTVSVDPETKRVLSITDAETAESATNAILNLDRNPAGQNANRNKTYRNQKEELDALMVERDVIEKQVAGEAKAPVTLVVEAKTDHKDASGKTLGEKIRGALTGEVKETAQLKIERNPTDSGRLAAISDSPVYDPYFIQTESEALQSDKILNQVIEKLNLNEAWAKKDHSTTPLATSRTRQLLKHSLQISSQPKTNLLNITVEGDEPEEAAKIADTIAEIYADFRRKQSEEIIRNNEKMWSSELAEKDNQIAEVKAKLAQLEIQKPQADAPIAKPAAPAPVPQPEVMTGENAFSTFSLNIADVSFKLAAASLEKGLMPEPASIRSEEFINAFDYRDPEPAPGAPLGFAWERAQYPFAQNRDLLRFSVKTAAAGREAGRPMNIVLLLDKSGSMERADRVRIIHEALRVLATQLQPQDKISVVTFARVARLWVDGLPGSQAAEVVDGVDKLTPEGGTNLEEAMRLAYETARRHYLAGGINRVVVLTDGAANLGNVDPESLKQKVEEHRKEGIALDCFGIGWEGYNDDLLEVLSRNGGGRYGFLNTPEEAASDFAGQLAGALHVAASDVKVQVEFNPKRVTAYRQIGYAKHQLTKEQFRDNTVNAAQIGAAESGNALYAIEVNPNGEGPLATVRVRYKVPGTEDYPEHSWEVPYTGGAVSLEQASPAMRLAGSASAFSEWLATSPFAGEVTTDQLLGLMRGVPETYGADERPKKLEWMIRQAKSLEGK